MSKAYRPLKALLQLLCGLLLVLGNVAFAHPMPSSLILLDVQERQVQAEVQLPLVDLSLALQTTPQQVVASQAAAVRSYLPTHLHLLTPDGRPWQVKVDDLALSQAEQTASGPYQEVTAHLTLTPPAGSSARDFTLKYDAVLHQVVTHSALVSVRRDWQTGLTGEEEPVEVGVIRVDPVDNSINSLTVHREPGSAWQGFVSLFKLGMSHIAEGTDHLLFLLTLLLPAPLLVAGRRWGGYAGGKTTTRHIVQIITAFTVGHSLTLILATLLRLNLPASPVEALIAVSILISAVHAARPLFPGRELLVAGLFGLIHGMAFSFTLAAMNLSTTQLLLSLLGFNLGIEAMQLLVMGLTLPWLVLLARTSFYAPVRLTGAALAFLAALGWLGNRLGWSNPLGQMADALSPYGPWGIALLALSALAATGFSKRKTHERRGG